MSQRAYTLAEIDHMREVIAVSRGFGKGPWLQMERDVIEGELRYHMASGTLPDAIEAKAAARASASRQGVANNLRPVMGPISYWP